MIIHAETGDQTQYLAREYNDNTIRFVIKYPELVDAKLIVEASKILVRRITILHSSFHVSVRGGKWEINDIYPEEEITTVYNITNDVFEAAKEKSLQAIDFEGKVQIKCFVFQNEKESAIVLLVGHMCADGQDAKYLLEKLIEIYNDLYIGGGAEKVVLKSGSRSLEQCYEGDNEKLRFDTEKLWKEKSGEIKSGYQFPTLGEGEKRMVVREISKKSITDCRKLEEKVTVNDVLLAAYYRAYTKQMELANNTPVGIASMIDLRRYICDGDSAGVTNLSGPISTNLTCGIGNDFSDTLSAVALQTKKQKEDEKAGMDFMLALKKVYAKIPFPLVIAVGRKIYGSMSIGLTNLGNIKSDDLRLGNVIPEEFIFAGPLKKKPALQISASGLDGKVGLCIISQCTNKDQKQLEELLSFIEWEIENAH